MRFNELNISRYLGASFRFETYDAGEKTRPMIEHLAVILDQLEPQGMDNFHRIWVSVRRPTFRQFYDDIYGYDLPYKEADASKIEEARKDYNESYPTPKVWHRLAIKHFTRESGEEFYAIFIDNNVVFGINDVNSRVVLEGVDLLEWAISEAEKVVENVREGTYQSKVLNRIPYHYRYGKIKRSDLWDAYPESKKAFLKPYQKSAVKKFMRIYAGGKSIHPPFQKMTARIFYEACAVIYESLGVRRDVRSYLYKENDAERQRYENRELTPKEMYYAIADGRDDGLRNVPMDDPAAFEDWREMKEPYYEFNGSHPWEIIPSFSISNSMHLVPRKEKSGEYFLELSGDAISRAPDTIIAANALYEKGYPVKIVNLDVMINRLEGDDLVRIVPEREFNPFGSTIHLPEGEIGQTVGKRVQWDFDEYKIKSE